MDEIQFIRCTRNIGVKIFPWTPCLVTTGHYEATSKPRAHSKGEHQPVISTNASPRHSFLLLYIYIYIYIYICILYFDINI